MPEELRNQFVIFGNLKINIDSLKQTIKETESCSKLVEDLHYIEKQLLNKASKDDCGVMIKLSLSKTLYIYSQDHKLHAFVIDAENNMITQTLSATDTLSIRKQELRITQLFVSRHNLKQYQDNPFTQIENVYAAYVNKENMTRGSPSYRIDDDVQL